MTVKWILWLASLLPQPHADRICLATTVYLEARSEPFEGQRAVVAGVGVALDQAVQVIAEANEFAVVRDAFDLQVRLGGLRRQLGGAGEDVREHAPWMIGLDLGEPLVLNYVDVGDKGVFHVHLVPAGLVLLTPS